MKHLSYIIEIKNNWVKSELHFDWLMKFDKSAQ